MEKSKLSELINSKDTKQLADTLKQEVSEYRKSDLFKNYLDFLSKTYNYSSRNVRFLLKQKRDIGVVASFTKWKALGYNIKKGSKSYKVFMPIIAKKYADGKPVLDDNGEHIKAVVGYKLGSVFEDSQLVEYDKLPKQIKYLEQDIDNEKKLFLALAKVSNVPVELKPLEHDGAYSPTNESITINAKLHGSDLIHTLIHEVTHARIHHDSNARFGDDKYKLQELEAETTAYIVAKKYDIDTSDYTLGYLNSWGLDKVDEKQLTEVLENIQKTASGLIKEIDFALEKKQEKVKEKTPLQEKIASAKNLQKGNSGKKEVENNNLFKSKKANFQ